MKSSSSALPPSSSVDARELRAAIHRGKLSPAQQTAWRALNDWPHTHVTVKKFKAGEINGTFDGRRWNFI
jgi:hypothetical protein